MAVMTKYNPLQLLPLLVLLKTAVAAFGVSVALRLAHQQPKHGLPGFHTTISYIRPLVQPPHKRPYETPKAASIASERGWCHHS